MPKPYSPPFSITPTVLNHVAQIGERLGRWTARAEAVPSPHLRRAQRVRTIQASLAIENNSLTLEQVTAVLDGRRVLAPPRDVHEVRNAFAAYERLPHWRPDALRNVLEAHAILMAGLVDTPGRWRTGGVGIYRGKRLVHMAPPASRVPKLMTDLVRWLARTDTHPLVASCVFHYEFEFIHPFADGNGRMGRLWQTLILSRWQPALAWLPVETVIRERQRDYYAALAASDRASNSTVFVEFMLDALTMALAEATTDQATDQVTDQATDQAAVQVDDRSGAAAPIARVAAAMRRGEILTASELMQRLGLRHRPNFRSGYLVPALDAGIVEMTLPDAPRSPDQKYRRTSKRSPK